MHTQHCITSYRHAIKVCAIYDYYTLRSSLHILSMSVELQLIGCSRMLTCTGG